MSQPVPRLGSTPSRMRMDGTPIFIVMLASALPAMLPLIAQSPTLPPLGLLFFVGWRLLHHELWPLWMAAPLGAFDDLASGSPLGTAIFLWSAITLGIELVDTRLFWRDYWHDWLIAIGAVILFLLGGLGFSHVSGSAAPARLVLPQILWSALLYPLIVRIIARTDRWRMMA
ncbi:MAG: rod shape-determining protein MreD [Sphingobium sp.]|nr:rod shape-determining protein MreD [Sphingobium sp.]MBP6111155.1 rod shape-determining protein MreD [Sphingobium sp.]MBP8669755.1 rod shape-determining protein MreD [Sphingobium sp.]MBP9156485.1 rod shape-determining protein MreD [Sphingobium sp.]MCC6480896.1 rod shape-determining protein MreD [Sphingomonadaceae bacterium]